mgnify:CR=1 FL=1
METFDWKEDVHLLCNTAKSFPDGIQESFDGLENNVPEVEKRTWYGISYMNEKGEIIYKAALNKLTPGEATEFESFTITKGTYLSEVITDWMKNPAQIGESFQKLLTDPRLDTSFPCVEWYYSADDVRCMIRLRD